MNADFQIDPEIYDKFSSYLQPHERVLWYGQPAENRVSRKNPFGNSVLILVFFIVVFGFLTIKDFGFARNFWLEIRSNVHLIYAATFAAAVMAAYFVYTSVMKPKERIYYAITNERVLTLSTGKKDELNQITITGNLQVDKWARKRGGGYIVVVEREAGDEDMEWPDSFSMAAGVLDGISDDEKGLIILRDIPKTDDVYDLLDEQMRSKPVEEPVAGTEREPRISLEPPPRKVPWDIKISALFGIIPSQLGWVFLCFMTIFLGLQYNASMGSERILITFILIIFFFWGSMLLYFPFNEGLRIVSLLKRGRIGYGKFTRFTPVTRLSKRSKRGPMVSGVDDKSVLRYFYTFKAEGKEYEVFADSLKDKKLYDQALEPLIYDEKNPENAVLLDSVPGRIRVNSDGHLIRREGSVFSSLKLLILPFVFVSIVLCLIFVFPLH